MLENINISNAAVKDSSATADAINYGGKAIALQRLMKLYSTEFPDPECFFHQDTKKKKKKQNDGTESSSSENDSDTEVVVVNNNTSDTLKERTSVFYYPSTSLGLKTSVDLEHTYVPIPFHNVSAQLYDEMLKEYHRAWEAGVTSGKTWFAKPLLHFDTVWKWRNTCVYCM
jgi:hypothetical protein